MSLPSGPRTITTSTVTFSRPMIRSIHSPPNTPGSPQSKPSTVRNRTVSSRSSTTRPMWTKSVMPGRCVAMVGAYAFGAAAKRLGKRRDQPRGELLAGVLDGEHDPLRVNAGRDPHGAPFGQVVDDRVVDEV